MIKPLILVTAAVMFAACTPVSQAPQSALVEPPTIGFDSCNPTATENLHQNLSRTGKAVCTSDETQELLALLAGAQSSTPLCAPADCFYLNLQAADGTWLMSLPVQKTPEGIVLLYLKLQGNNAGAPLQGWWQGLCSRLGI